MCWCLSYKSAVQVVASQEVQARKMSAEGLLLGYQRNSILAVVNMYEPHLLFSLKPAGLFLNILAESGFPGSKKHEPKLNSALHAGL